MATPLLFETDFELGLELFNLKVYRSVISQEIIYNCVLDDDDFEDAIPIVKGIDNKWYQLEGGTTNLVEMMGKIIDENYSTENK